ncbi:MAG: DNA recombination protein RmuC [Caldilineaceae bacterium]|nr:DNA recombination protein RmuC [Caldilineaceae bacterium]
MASTPILLNAILLVSGLLIGSTLGWLLCQLRNRTYIEMLRIELTQLKGANLLEIDKGQWLREARNELQLTFEALANKTLQTNADEFLKRASERVDTIVGQVRSDWNTQKAELTGVVDPLKENLSILDGYVRELEQKREGAYQGVQEQLRQLAQTQTDLQMTTTSLAQALKTPQVRGRWGELQLRRVVEMAGMVKHVHFVEQVATEGGRPDLISYLPNRGILPVDAKTPLNAYLEAAEATDETTRRRKLGEHVRAIRTHIAELSKKQYWEQFTHAPDFVVMFIPNEACLNAAYEHDPDLLEYAVTQKVLITTPITLLALLRTVAYGWQQQQITENAQQIAEQGRDLHQRLGNFVAHLADLRTALERSMKGYNRLIGSFDSRILPTIRKLEEMGLGNNELKLPETIASQARVSIKEKEIE